jgi:hypothetical protein
LGEKWVNLMENDGRKMCARENANANDGDGTLDGEMGENPGKRERGTVMTARGQE